MFIMVKIGFYNNSYGWEKLLKVFCILSAGNIIFVNYKGRISSMVSPVNLLISSGFIPCRFIESAIAATTSTNFIQNSCTTLLPCSVSLGIYPVLST